MGEPSQPDEGSVLVTGIAGNLGSRLLLQMSGSKVIGVDLCAPASEAGLARFESVDLGNEACCDQLIRIFREENVRAVVHLAFVIDPVRTGVLDVERMWQINVAGTARAMEAIAEVNRHGGRIEKFVFISSVSAYGPETPGPVDEDFRLAAHTLPYAVHKMQADEVARNRSAQMGGCATIILRPHIFVGATMQNYLIGALRGTPTGKGKRAERLRGRRTRLPIVVPFGQRYLENLFQFVHVDDVARLIACVLKRNNHDPLTVMNVAGRGEPLRFAECAAIAQAKLVRLPGRAACRWILNLMWKLGISGVPPDALPYIVGSYTMNTLRLQKYLGQEYKTVIRYTITDALADSFDSDHRAQSAIV